MYWIQLVVSVTELKYAKNIKPRGGIEDLNKEYVELFCENINGSQPLKAHSKV